MDFNPWLAAKLKSAKPMVHKEINPISLYSTKIKLQQLHYNPIAIGTTNLVTMDFNPWLAAKLKSAKPMVHKEINPISLYSTKIKLQQIHYNPSAIGTTDFVTMDFNPWLAAKLKSAKPMAQRETNPISFLLNQN